MRQHLKILKLVLSHSGAFFIWFAVGTAFSVRAAAGASTGGQEEPTPKVGLSCPGGAESAQGVDLAGELCAIPGADSDLVDDDWDLVADESSQPSLLLPSFALGVTSQRTPLAPPIGRTKQLWFYRYDVDLGFRFRREASPSIEASVGGSLSYPIRLVNALGRPIVSFALRGEARLVGSVPICSSSVASEPSSSSSHIMTSDWWIGLGVSGQEIQYSRHSLDVYHAHAAAGVRVFWTPHAEAFLFPRGHSVVALLSGQIMPPPGYYTTTESSPTERFDEAAQVASPFSWKSRGGSHAWKVSSELAWLAPGEDDAVKPSAAVQVSRPRDSVAVGYEYGETVFDGLLESGQGVARRRAGIQASESFFYLRWRRLFAAAGEGSPSSSGDSP